jgi:hypothetical protein
MASCESSAARTIRRFFRWNPLEVTASFWPAGAVSIRQHERSGRTLWGEVLRQVEGGFGTGGPGDDARSQWINADRSRCDGCRAGAGSRPHSSRPKPPEDPLRGRCSHLLRLQMGVWLRQRPRSAHSGSARGPHGPRARGLDCERGKADAERPADSSALTSWNLGRPKRLVSRDKPQVVHQEGAARP